MSIVKLNNRSVKDVTAFGSISSLGELTFIKKQTISSPVSYVDFVHGSSGVVLDSTYKEYIFFLNSMHHNSNSEPDITVNFSIDSGVNFNVAKTSTSYRALHGEGGENQILGWYSTTSEAQDTAGQYLSLNAGADADHTMSGYIHLMNPSSTTFVKHYIGQINEVHVLPRSNTNVFAGYCNTTSAINAVRFNGEYAERSDGNIDSGEILLFGLN